MTIDDLYNDIAKDFSIDITDITKESVKSSELFVKYIKLYSQESLRLELLESNKKELVIKKRNYYAGNGTPEEYKENPFSLKLKTDTAILKYVESDADILKYDQKILVQKQKVTVLKECMEEIKRRSFNIKNIIEYQKFINGG